MLEEQLKVAKEKNLIDIASMAKEMNFQTKLMDRELLQEQTRQFKEGVGNSAVKKKVKQKR